MREVRVTNMTSLFSKEMLIYSFFDLRLKSPLRVVAILYFVLLFLLVGLPVFIIFPFNVYSVIVALGIPVGGAILMSKPIWNGKSFLSYAKTHIKYFSRPKVLFDWKSKPKETVYVIENEITVSRHDDYNKLYKLVKEESATNV